VSVRSTVKNGERCWLVEVYVEGERVRRFRDTEEEARRAEARILEGLDGPGKHRVPRASRTRTPGTGSPTLAEFAPRFMKNYAKLKNKPSEYDSKESKLRIHLLPEFGHLRLDQITSERLAEFASDRLEDDASPKTVNNILTTLHMALKMAVEWGDLARAPKIPWLEVPETEFVFLDFAPARAMLDAADEPMWGEMILVAVRTGLRLGELRALRAEDVDLKCKVLRVRRSAYKAKVGTPKTKASRREVPLSESAVEAIKVRLSAGHKLVFCNEDGSMLTKEQCKWPLWRACDRAGLDRMGWHVLRHTFASHLAMRGRTLKEIQELLGHTSIKMTLRYAHLSPDVKREAVAVLDED
jgi:integrase